MSNKLQLRSGTLPVVGGANIDGFIQAAHQFPVLTKEEEYELARDYRQNGNLEAAKALVLHNLRFVIKIARGYSGYGLPLADMVQEGNIGLMKAVKRFDPEMGVRLVSFAVHWIRAEIHEYILRNWRIVKVATTKAQRKLFFNLRSAKKRLGWMNQEEINAIADDLGVKPEEVMEMESRLSNRDVGFDLPANDDDREYASPVAYLTHDGEDPLSQLENDDSQHHEMTQLTQALAQLDERSQDIVRRRWLNEDGKETLQTLADEYGVSAERIRQLEKNAFKKMRAAMAA